MWNWPSFSSVPVSYSISYSFQRVFQTLKWVLFLQVIFEILTFYFGFHTFHVYTHRHMYIHSVMCTSSCKYMYINILPFTFASFYNFSVSCFCPSWQGVARECVLNASPLLVLALPGVSRRVWWALEEWWSPRFQYDGTWSESPCFPPLVETVVSKQSSECHCVKSNLNTVAKRIC